MKLASFGFIVALLTGPGAALAGPVGPRTPLSEAALSRALTAGHLAVFRRFPSKARLRVAWAQTALETGRGKLTRGYNIGQIDNGAARFPSARAGAAAYWRAVRKCKPALAIFDRAEPETAGDQLGRCGYHRAGAGYGERMAALWPAALRVAP